MRQYANSCRLPRYIRAFDGSVTLPVAGYNGGGNWTIPPAGLPPAGSAASVALALDFDDHGH
jgi:hypothetical protein